LIFIFLPVIFNTKVKNTGMIKGVRLNNVHNFILSTLKKIYKVLQMSFRMFVQKMCCNDMYLLRLRISY